MSLRAIWIVSTGSNLLYSRYFPSVEARCRSTLGDSFVKIPPENEFVKSLLTEVGLREGDSFVEFRDRCDKQVLYPSFELKTMNGILWPIVIMECNGIILCTLPHDDNTPFIHPSVDQVSLGNVPSVAQALEFLNALAERILKSRSPSSEGNFSMAEIAQYVNVSLPFGRLINFDIPVGDLLKTLVKGKAKVPAWNPMPHKGKSQVVLHIKEEVRCMQFNHTEVKDPLDVFGTVTCKAEVEGNVPEISLVLIQSAGGSKSDLVVNPGVCNVENISQTSSRLRFYPSNTQPLCHYSLPLITDPPIYGVFSMKMSDNVASVNLQLQLRNSVKNLFQQLEVQIPFPGFSIQSVRPNYSQGSVKIHSKNTVAWNIGSKLPSKTLNATLNAVVKLNRFQTLNSAKTDSTSCIDNRSTTFSDNSPENINSAYALVFFKIADFTISGTKIDPQSIVVSTAAKVRCSVSSELISMVYKLWNSEGEVPIPASIYAEELRTLLK